MTEILKNIDHEKFLSKKLKALTKKRNLVKKYLQKNNVNYLHEVGGGMNFYIDLKRNSARLIPKLLKNYKIALIPGVLFEGKLRLKKINKSCQKFKK